MELENIICSFEQAKKLKALGINQNNSYFIFNDFSKKAIEVWAASEDREPDFYSAAFCDTELAVMLDAFYETYRTENNKWLGGNLSIENEADTPAQATAAHLIHLLETDERLTVEMANERLLNACAT